MSFPVKRALISCFDKTGVVEFAQSLHNLGIEIVSSGGTARAISDASIPVMTVEDVTGMPEMFDHRVVTLHPKIHGGILADLEKDSHHEDMKTFGIQPFGLVVVNLYPFFEKQSIETIDIGGPAMVRAAAKNNSFVGVVTNPNQYGEVLDELKNNSNVLTDKLRWKLAREAYALTASFDAAIVDWMNATDYEFNNQHADDVTISLKKVRDLRYGENPHQKAALYESVNHAPSWPQTMKIHQGKELSYINYLDIQASWSLVNQLENTSCVIVKHANPCGVASADNINDAYKNAFACDDISAFGGVVAFNSEVDEQTAKEVISAFTEVVIAPSFSTQALETFSSKKNIRIITADKPSNVGWDIKHIDGAFLFQDADDFYDTRQEWNVVTEKKPNDEEMKQAIFAWKVCAATNSNAIVLTNNFQAVGIGAGQQSRVHSAEIAAKKAGDRAKGGACASDAFFPFRDGIDAAAETGVSVVIQPGGSMRDEEVIQAANEHNIAMIFTSTRHFRH